MTDDTRTTPDRETRADAESAGADGTTADGQRTCPLCGFVAAEDETMSAHLQRSHRKRSIAAFATEHL